VDIGRVRLAATEVQITADASARAAADSLPITLAKTVQNASDTALANGVIDEDETHTTPNGARTNPGVDLDPAEDIEFGTWDPKQTQLDKKWHFLGTGAGPFKTANDPLRRSNAVHVTARQQGRCSYRERAGVVLLRALRVSARQLWRLLRMRLAVARCRTSSSSGKRV